MNITRICLLSKISNDHCYKVCMYFHQMNSRHNLIVWQYTIYTIYLSHPNNTHFNTWCIHQHWHKVHTLAWLWHILYTNTLQSPVWNRDNTVWDTWYKHLKSCNIDTLKSLVNNIHILIELHQYFSSKIHSHIINILCLWDILSNHLSETHTVRKKCLRVTESNVNCILYIQQMMCIVHNQPDILCICSLYRLKSNPSDTMYTYCLTNIWHSLALKNCKFYISEESLNCPNMPHHCILCMMLHCILSRRYQFNYNLYKFEVEHWQLCWSSKIHFYTINSL